ncbi:MAG: formimidoylglutamate deiminase [Myxococcota bacterium]
MHPRVSSVAVDHALTTEGWRSPACFEIDASGRITAIRDLPPPGAPTLRLRGWAIPGLPNLHSHAFQRALSGRTEEKGASTDSFWTWRELMYGLAGTLEPEEIGVIARALYVEMLEAGMTSVAEFHYLHHDPSGQPYADPAELSRRLVEAAKQAGIDLLLLPVLYQTGGFHQPPKPSQRRFLHPRLDDFLRLFEALSAIPELRVGVAPHSLRAVPTEILRELVRAIPATTPIHIHISEQRAEVEQALSLLGARPIRHLVDQIGLDPRWCLVHATHADPQELEDIARAGAVAGLCPTTEANLGDGIFDGAAFWAQGGRFGLGSDSHATISVAEELRWLEYGQRLRAEQRNVLGDHGRLGASLYAAALRGGAQALALPRAGLEVGAFADVVVLDGDHPRLIDHDARTILDAFIFGSADRAIAHVLARGAHVVKQGRHVDREAAFLAYRSTLRRALERRPG